MQSRVIVGLAVEVVSSFPKQARRVRVKQQQQQILESLMTTTAPERKTRNLEYS